MKKQIIILVLLLGIIALGGCSTVKNVSEGLGKGISEDVHNTWKHLKRSDAWLRENTW
jgi:predicted small secreted protein